jgi:hypothetical protein
VGGPGFQISLHWAKSFQRPGGEGGPPDPEIPESALSRPDSAGTSESGMPIWPGLGLGGSGFPTRKSESRFGRDWDSDRENPRESTHWQSVARPAGHWHRGFRGSGPRPDGGPGRGPSLAVLGASGPSGNSKIARRLTFVRARPTSPLSRPGRGPGRPRQAPRRGLGVRVSLSPQCPPHTKLKIKRGGEALRHALRLMAWTRSAARYNRCDHGIGAATY